MVNIFSRVNSIVAEAGRKVEQKYLRLCEKNVDKKQTNQERLSFCLEVKTNNHRCMYVYTQVH